MAFIPQAHLEAALRENDVAVARQALQTYLGQDPGNVTGLPGEAFAWVATRVPDLVEEHDEDQEPLREDAAVWNRDYWLDQKTALSFNFSRERWEHLLEIGAKLQAESEEHFQPMPGLLRDAHESERECDSPPRSFVQVLIGVLLLSGSLVLGGALVVMEAGIFALGVCALLGLVGAAILTNSFLSSERDDQS